MNTPSQGDALPGGAGSQVSPFDDPEPYVLTFADGGPAVVRFDSARSLLAFASGFCGPDRPALIVSPKEIRA